MISAYSFQIDRMSIENNEPAVAGTNALPGSLLQKAREEKGLTIDEMSAISNLTKQVIRGIEADDYTQLAGLSFVRGYLKLYAKKLGVDEVEILDLFDRWKAEQNGEPRQYANAPQGISEPSSGPSQKTIIAASIVVIGLISAGGVISYLESTGSSPEVASVIETEQAPASTEPDAALNQSQELTPSLDSSVDASINGTVEAQPLVTEAEQSASATVAPASLASQADEVVAQSEPATLQTEAEPVVEAPNPDPVPVEKPKTVEKTKQIETPKTVEKLKPTEKPKVAKTEPPPAVTEPVDEALQQPVVISSSNLSQGGRVIAEASGLAPAPSTPVQTTQVSPGQDDGLRVLSETRTGPSADQLAMGAQGRLKIDFSGESWIEIRDARGRLILADLMSPEQGVELDTFGPIEILVGAVSVSTVVFNGETQDLKPKAYQDVARITLGAEPN
jgi:cytoskeleton protein RodZ